VFKGAASQPVSSGVDHDRHFSRGLAWGLSTSLVLHGVALAWMLRERPAELIEATTMVQVALVQAVAPARPEPEALPAPAAALRSQPEPLAVMSLQGDRLVEPEPEPEPEP
jgi:periplasmic protein TonB